MKSPWYRPQRVDEDGVPCLIQHMRYCYITMEVSVLFFNGEWKSFYTDHVCPSMNLMQCQPTRMQWLEIENAVTRAAEVEWKCWFPSKLRIVA